MKLKYFRQVFLSMAIMLASSQAFSACGFADFGENKVIDSTFRGVNYSSTVPANYYVALYTTSCLDAATGTEVSGGSYARATIPRTAAEWNATNGTNGLTSNINPATFPAATADWGIVVSWCLVDTASGAANAIVCADLTAARNVTTGSTPSFAGGTPGAMTITVD